MSEVDCQLAKILLKKFGYLEKRVTYLEGKSRDQQNIIHKLQTKLKTFKKTTRNEECEVCSKSFLNRMKNLKIDSRIDTGVPSIDDDADSEVDANSGDEEGIKKGQKRKKKSPTKSKRSKKSKIVNVKRRKVSNEESDDEKDEDFLLDPKVFEVEEKEKKKRLEEEQAEMNKVNFEEEKRRIDMLYAAFLNSVKEENSTDSRRSNTNSTTTEIKMYDFAGEKFQDHEEKLNSIPDPSTSNGFHKKPSSSSASANASSLSQFNVFHHDDTGRRVSSYLSNGTSISDPSRAKQYIPPRRKGISNVLSSNPAAIGLNVKSGNLTTVLNAIVQNKSKKLGTLEKTKLDSQAFKKSEGIEEELKNHVQSKDSFLERQDFLQRTDVRQFELEKNTRARKRNRRHNP